MRVLSESYKGSVRILLGFDKGFAVWGLRAFVPGLALCKT